jgi:oligoribonuclease NrnB/cAMP/cGMP phosphodiesterase (DHH superfamily)
VSLALKKPDLILTHESDLDGFVSGLLLQRLGEKLFGTKVRLEAYHNQSWRNRQMPENAAWVSDMTFEQRIDKENWLVIDHHPNEHEPKYAKLVHDLNKSASLLVYELCREQGLQTPELNRLVHLTNVNDLFLTNDPDFDQASDYGNLIKLYGFWNVHELIEGQLERLLEHPLLEVMAVKRRVENPLGYEWSKSRVQQITPTVGYVESIVGNVNLIVHQLLERQATPYPVLLTLFRKGNGMIIVSLRSRQGEALSVAEKLRGGGHANACGATLPRSIQNIPEAINYLKRELNRSQTRESVEADLEQAFADLENKK